MPDELTSAICGPTLLYAIPKTAFPKNGPSNHPTPPLPSVIKPSTMNGSRPKPLMCSMFSLVRADMPPAVVSRELKREEARL